MGSPPAEGVFAGIDWGNSHHQLCILDSEGQLVEQGSVTHDVAGIRELHRSSPGGAVTGGTIPPPASVH